MSATSIPVSKAVSVPLSATTAINPEKVSATQRKFQNFDSEITQLISGLKSNLTKEPEEESPSLLDDDKLLLDNDDEPLALTPTKHPNNETVAETPKEQQPVAATTTTTNESAVQVNLNKPLADIAVDLNEIRPHDDFAPRCIMDEKSGLKIMLNFTKDKPRTDVAVLVITITNQNPLCVRNFQFEASVPKVSDRFVH